MSTIRTSTNWIILSVCSDKVTKHCFMNVRNCCFVLQGSCPIWSHSSWRTLFAWHIAEISGRRDNRRKLESEVSGESRNFRAPTRRHARILNLLESRRSWGRPELFGRFLWLSHKYVDYYLFCCRFLSGITSRFFIFLPSFYIATSADFFYGFVFSALWCFCFSKIFFWKAKNSETEFLTKFWKYCMISGH